jgi:hypothetical protein
MNATVSKITVTPAIAKKLLASLFEGQRPLVDNYINRLANEMTNGDWRLSPDCLVKIKGKVGNGQHRLHAVVRSQTTQPFLLLDTDDNELYKVIDAGNKRSVADVLSGDYRKEVATAARWVVLYDLDGLCTSGEKNREAAQCTRSLCIEFAESQHPVLQPLVSTCYHLNSKFHIVAPSMAAAVAYIAKRDCPKAEAGLVDKFIQNIYDGESHDDAARDFRERIIRSKVGSSRLHRCHVLALLIKSLRSYLNGTRLSVVRLNEGEGFPRLK